MDLIYMPEALSYGSVRHPQYRDYEQPWNKDYFNYGKSTTRTRSQQQHRQQMQKPTAKQPCLICKENKRRTLAAYIRGKARNNSCGEIHEEIEEIEEEDEREQQQQQQQLNELQKAGVEENKTFNKNNKFDHDKKLSRPNNHHDDDDDDDDDKKTNEVAENFK